MKSTAHRRSRGALLAAVLLAAAAAEAQPQWPAFRGANAAGTAAARLPDAWDLSTGRNVAWSTPVPGLAHSSPIVWGERVYVTTAVAATGGPELKTGAAGIASASDTGPHTWRLIALDRRTGRVLWDRAVHEGTPRMKRHVKASHASATPATDGRFIVALLGSEGLFCFDMEGKQRWRVDLGVMDVGLVDDPTYQWGPASSPLIFEDRVIVQNDRHKDSYLAAYDLASGRELWRTAHDEYPSWATPVVLRGRSRTEIVTNGGKFIRGFDPATGRELWQLPDNNTQVKVPTPVVAGDLVIVTGGYPGGGRPIYAIRAGGTGALAAGNLAWQTERGSPYTGTPVAHDGILYVCTDNGILSAYDVATGARHYQQRLDAAGAFSASPIVSGNRLYLASEDGDVFVVETGPAFKLVSRSTMKEVTMATPAVAGDTLIVRTQGRVVGIRATS